MPPRSGDASTVVEPPSASSSERPMSDVRAILQRGVRGAAPPPDEFERMLRRRDRKRRNKRIASAVVAGIVVAVVGGAAVSTYLISGPASHPAESSSPPSVSLLGRWETKRTCSGLVGALREVNLAPL